MAVTARQQAHSRPVKSWQLLVVGEHLEWILRDPLQTLADLHLDIISRHSDPSAPKLHSNATRHAFLAVTLRWLVDSFFVPQEGYEFEF